MRTVGCMCCSVHCISSQCRHKATVWQCNLPKVCVDCMHAQTTGMSALSQLSMDQLRDAVSLTQTQYTRVYNRQQQSGSGVRGSRVGWVSASVKACGEYALAQGARSTCIAARNNMLHPLIPQSPWDWESARALTKPQLATNLNSNSAMFPALRCFAVGMRQAWPTHPSDRLTKALHSVGSVPVRAF